MGSNISNARGRLLAYALGEMALSTGLGTQSAYGLLRQDSHIALRVSSTTSQRYKDAALTFISYCHRVRAYPETAADYDMWVLEFKNDPEENPKKSAFSYVIASIEHFFPHFKGHYLCVEQRLRVGKSPMCRNTLCL